MENDVKVFEDIKNNFKNNLLSDLKVLSGLCGPDELGEIVDDFLKKLYK